MFGLRDTDIVLIHNVLAKYPEVEAVTIYGSRATGNFKPASDIDLTLHGNALNRSTMHAISNELYELPIPFTVDLSIFHDLTQADIIDHIRRVGVTFYEKGKPPVSQMQSELM